MSSESTGHATTKPAIYPSGHHASVLRSHTSRTAANSAAYLLPFLLPDMKILDVGCGPGTITCDFGKLVQPGGGNVIGVDVENVLDTARKIANDQHLGDVVKFEAGDIHSLAYEDASFDVVHAHQVLQHIGDPVQALKEMKRVTKKGGLVAVRESDFATMTWFPDIKGIQEWKDLWYKVSRANGGEPDAGRRIVSWAMQAGFAREDIEASTGSTCINTQEEREWWSGLWAERVVKSDFAKSAIAGHATMEDLEEISGAWRIWGKQDDAWFGNLHGQILCRV